MTTRPPLTVEDVQRFDVARPMWPAAFDLSDVHFPRTSAEAFRDAEYACAIERYRHDPADRIVLWGCAVVGVVFAVLVVLRWLPGS